MTFLLKPMHRDDHDPGDQAAKSKLLLVDDSMNSTAYIIDPPGLPTVVNHNP